MRFWFQESRAWEGWIRGGPTIDPEGARLVIEASSENEARYKLPFTGTGRRWIYLKDHKDEVELLEKDLQQAYQIINSGLLLRIHGDISYMPMSQREWDFKAEEFSRRMASERNMR